MTIDLDTTEGRKEYIADKFEDLLDGINDSYGTLLMEELLLRLELTVKDFNDEMKILCDELVTKEKERQQFLEMLKTSEDIPAPAMTQGAPPDLASEIPEGAAPSALEELDEDLPEWEKKLARIEKK